MTIRASTRSLRAMLLALTVIIYLACGGPPPFPAEGDGTWDQLAHDATGPTPRGYVNAMPDPTSDGLLIYGGCDNSLQCHSDLWHLDVGAGTWSPRTGPGLAGPAGLVYDSESSLFVTFIDTVTPAAT